MKLTRTLQDGATIALRGCGVERLARATHARRHAAVLVYHDPSPRILEAHLRFLTRRYAVLSLDALAAALAEGRSVPERAVVLTLDDGHRGNVALAPVLRRHGVRPTIYLCSGIVGTSRRFWWTTPGIDPAALKHCHDDERLRQLAAVGFRPEDPGRSPQALTLDDLGALADTADFGAHTRFHPILTRCDAAVAAEEIVRSKEEVEALTGRPCHHFSYPNGDFGPREVEVVRAAGYRSARTTVPGWNSTGTDVHALHAIGVPDDASVHQLAARLAGTTWFAGRARTLLSPAFRGSRIRPSPGQPGSAGA